MRFHRIKNNYLYIILSFIFLPFFILQVNIYAEGNSEHSQKSLLFTALTEGQRGDLSSVPKNKKQEKLRTKAKKKAKLMNKLWDAKNLYHLANKKENINELISLMLKAKRILIPIYKNKQYSDLRQDAKSLLRKITKLINSLPSPISFIPLNYSIKMILCERENSPSYYMSEKPVSAELFAEYLNNSKSTILGMNNRIKKFLYKNKQGVWEPINKNTSMNKLTHNEALSFSKWFSKNTGMTYRLPYYKELLFFGKSVKKSWTNSIALTHNYYEKDMRERFATNFFVIYDPRASKGIGELPSAYYNDLSFYLICSDKTGKRSRLKRLGGFNR